MPSVNSRVISTVSSLLEIIAAFLVFYVSLNTGITWVTAHLIAFLAGSIVTYCTLSLLSVSKGGDNSAVPSFVTIQFLALFLGGGVLAVLVQTMTWSPHAAIISHLWSGMPCSPVQNQ